MYAYLVAIRTQMLVGNFTNLGINLNTLFSVVSPKPNCPISNHKIIIIANVTTIFFFPTITFFFVLSNRSKEAVRHLPYRHISGSRSGCDSSMLATARCSYAEDILAEAWSSIAAGPQCANIG